jgi:H+/Cl- antiporter ClcA
VTASPPPDDPATPAAPGRLVDRRWLSAILLASVVAIPAALITIIYVGSVNVVTDVIWDDLYAWTGLPRPVFVLVIPIIGGLIVGLIIRFAPGRGGPEPAAGHGLGGDAHESAGYLPGVVVASLVSLVAGASLGPEGPLVTIVGGLATLTAVRLRLPAEASRLMTISGISSLTSGVFGSPLAAGLLLAETAPLAGLELYRRIIPALAAGTVGYFLFAAIVGTTLHPLFPGASDLGLAAFATALALGIVGGFAGLAYIELFHRLRTLVAALDGYPILKATLGGAVVGVVAVVIGELTLFSGEHQVDDVVAQAGTLGVSGLGLLLVGKVVVALVSLVSGFRGGRIFPIMFLGAVLGLIASELVPGVSQPVAVAAGMGALGVSSLRIPLFMVILAGVFTSLTLVPVILVAVVTSYAITVGHREL